MARTVTLIQQLMIQAIESIDSSIAPASFSGSSLTFDQYALNNMLNSVSDPATFGHVIDLSSPSAGAAGTDTDYDLTAAPVARGPYGGGTVDASGRKLLSLQIYALSTNVGNITVKPHPTTNAYNLFGAGGLHVMEPGRYVSLGFAAGSTLGTPEVDATHKVIRVSATALDKWACLLVMGSNV